MNRQKIANGFLTAALFLLPWQTILMYRQILLPEGQTVYGNLGVYLVELLLVVVFLLRGRPIIHPVYKNILRTFFLFSAACFISLTFSSVFLVSLGWISHFVAGGMLFLLLLDDRTNISYFMRVFLAGLVLPCILGWIQYLTGFSPTLTVFGLAEKQVETGGVAVVATDVFRSLRAYGPFPHPNIFGGYLAIAILLFGWMNRKTNHHKNLYGMFATIFFIILFTSTFILTFSRSAWLALAIGLSVGWILWVTSRKKQDKMYQKNIVGIFFTTVLLMGIFLYPQIFARFNPSLHVEAISIAERTSQYQNYVRLLSPLAKGGVGGGSVWLFGVGPGAYIFALESLSPNQPPWSYQPIHNVFLLLLAEIGIVGFLAFGYLLFEISRCVLPLLSKERAGVRSSGRIFATTLLSELLILTLFDHYLFSMWSGIALAAIVLAISVRLTNEF